MKRQNNRHLAVVTFNDVPAINYAFKYNRLGLMAMENRQKYCERHGYDFISDIESKPNSCFLEIWNGIGNRKQRFSLLRQNPTYRLRIKYVQNLQNHPKFFGSGDRFVHFYGDDAPHIIPLPECEEVLRRWTAASRGEGPAPVDIARFHWCCIQNIHPGGPVCGDIHHYFYSPSEIAPGQAEPDGGPLFEAGLT